MADQDPACLVLLVRHGEANYAALRSHGPVYEGARSDLAPLSDRGVVQAEQLAATLARYRPALVVSSPYTRTLHTAALLAARLQCRLAVDLCLHDWLPVRDGASVITPEVVRQKVAEYDDWKRDGRLPDQRTWESDEEMRERLIAVVGRRAAEPALVIVTHEAVIKAATGAATVALASWHRLVDG
ncbi:MAG: histidine phosphatase family protein [Pseudonocardiaceae bacterium]